MASMKKEVTFGNLLTIQEYPIILGDNPACKQGAPIQIDWKAMNRYTRNLDLYEYTQSEFRRKPKAKNNNNKCRLSIGQRSQMLLDAGYTREQIIQRVLEVEEIRQLRAETVSTLDVSGSSLLKSLSKNSGLGKFSKDIMNGFSSTFAMIGVGPAKPTKAITVIARTA